MTSKEFTDCWSTFLNQLSSAPTPTQAINSTTIITPILSPSSLLESTKTTNPDCFLLPGWKVYEDEYSYLLPDDHCWGIANLGISSEMNSNGLITFNISKLLNSNQREIYGIYFPFQGNKTFSFTIKVDRITTSKDSDVNISFGVIEANKNNNIISPNININNVIYYYYNKTQCNSQICEIPGKDGKYLTAAKIPTINIGETKKVVMQVTNNTLMVFIDNISLANNPITLPYDEKAFWLGYSIPSDGNIIATVSDFVITN